MKKLAVTLWVCWVCITLFLFCIGSFWGYKIGVNKTEVKYKTIADTMSYKIPTEAWILDGDFPRKVKFYEVIWERPELKGDLEKSYRGYNLTYWDWHERLKIENLFATKEDACKMAKARIQETIKFEQDKLNQIDCNNK
jgi:hypothetical protein